VAQDCLACPVCPDWPGRVLVLPLGRCGTLLNGGNRRPWDERWRVSFVLAVYGKNWLDQRAALVRRQDAPV
jgi:hypothetical protein